MPNQARPARSKATGRNSGEPDERLIARMWSDTLNLLHEVLGNLPSGPFGAIIRLCGAAIVLLALLTLVDFVSLRDADLAIEIVIVMFLFFMASVVVYIVRPPYDYRLADAQERRMRQIAPRPLKAEANED